MKPSSFQFAKSFFIIIVLFVTSSVALNQLQFDGGNFSVSWNYLSVSQEVEFEVRAKTTGYVALGLTKVNSGMQSLDLFVGGVNSVGDYLKDYYSSTQALPIEDSQQDYSKISASESNGITVVRCKRRLNTQDSNDLQIQPGDKVYFAWAIHSSSDSLTYHERRGYSPQMHELVPVPQTTTPPPTTAPTAPATTSPSVVYNRQLSFKNGNYQLFWKFDSKTNELFFKLVVKAAGWVGLGFSNTNSAMTDMDTVVAGVSGGQGYIEDYFSATKGTPPRDLQQDYSLTSATESGGTTTVEFKRKINTGDNNDLQIVPGTPYYIAWAYHGSSDSFIYHSQRGYSQQKVVLIQAAPSSSPTSSTMATTSSIIATTSTMATTSSIATTRTVATTFMATTSSMAAISSIATTPSMSPTSMATTSAMSTTSMATTSSMTTTPTMATTLSMATTSTMAVRPTTSSTARVASTTAPSTTPQVVYNKESSFKNGNYHLFWKFDSNTNELFFKLVVKAAGWVGLGFSNISSAMTNMDTVVAGVSGGQGYIGDYYSTNQDTPPRDSQQDYTLLGATESGDTTTVEFKRKLITGDNKDLQIKPGASYYIAWAYHSSSDKLIYHSQRGYSQQKVVLAADVTTTKSSPDSSSPTKKPTPTKLTAGMMSCSVVVVIFTFCAALVIQ